MAAPNPTANRAAVNVFSEGSLRSNLQTLESCRTWVSAISGAAAGILGLSGLYGFAFYVVASIIYSVLVFVRVGAHWSRFVLNRSMLVTNGFFAGLITYVLFWTFLFGLVHVY